MQIYITINHKTIDMIYLYCCLFASVFCSLELSIYINIGLNLWKCSLSAKASYIKKYLAVCYMFRIAVYAPGHQLCAGLPTNNRL